MPELPEVETIARTLAPSVTGRTIIRLTLLNPGTWEGGISPELLHAHRIVATERRGKLLLIRLEPSPSGIMHLAFHLKMTGRLFCYPPGTPPDKHTRLIADLDDGTRLFFDDSRKFGYVKALDEKTLKEWPFWQKLGPEPLVIESKEFVRIFNSRGGAIKALLLDQTMLAGVGNIYADESLFRAGIRPDTAGKSISPARLKALHAHLVEVLTESIEACGSSIRDYRTARGDAGAFQNAFKVYGRAGKPCTMCGTLLAQARVAGRTTVYCPSCQNP